MSIKKLAPSILATTLLSQTMFANASEEDLQKQIDELNSKITELTQKSDSNSDSISSLISKDIQDAVTFNGFASFGLSQLSKNGKSEKYYYGQGSDLSILPNTWLGLQMNARLYEKGEVIAQVVSKGNNDKSFDLDMEWLFYKQDLGANFSAQLGRIRFPVFIDSEVVYIGNIYPTVAPPAEIYSILPINHIDGTSVSYSGSAGDWGFDAKAVIWGNSSENYNGYNLSLHRIFGVSFGANNDALSMHVGVFRAEERIEITDPVYAAEFGDVLTYKTAAIRYDDQRFYVSAEGISIKTKRDLLDENRNWNITAGVYAGPVLFYVGHSSTRITNSSNLINSLSQELGSIDLSALYNLPPNTLAPVPRGYIYEPFLGRRQATETTGIKYNIAPNIALKAQVQYAAHFDGTQGNFSSATANISFNHMYIYDLAIQASF